jgi:hypothetical protein
MSQQILIEMSDRAYESLIREAEALGTTPSVVAASTLEQRFGENGAVGEGMTEVEIEEARQRFERHFGELSLPDIVLSDNEQIDADLAREYGSTHEET